LSLILKIYVYILLFVSPADDGLLRGWSSMVSAPQVDAREIYHNILLEMRDTRDKTRNELSLLMKLHSLEASISHAYITEEKVGTHTTKQQE